MPLQLFPSSQLQTSKAQAKSAEKKSSGGGDNFDNTKAHIGALKVRAVMVDVVGRTEVDDVDAVVCPTADNPIETDSRFIPLHDVAHDIKGAVLFHYSSADIPGTIIG